MNAQTDDFSCTFCDDLNSAFKFCPIPSASSFLCLSWLFLSFRGKRKSIKPQQTIIVAHLMLQLLAQVGSRNILPFTKQKMAKKTQRHREVTCKTCPWYSQWLVQNVMCKTLFPQLKAFASFTRQGGVKSDLYSLGY